MKNPSSSPKLHRRTAPPHSYFKQEVLAEWLKGTVSCSIPSGALHCFCWGRALAAASQAQQCSQECRERSSSAKGNSSGIQVWCSRERHPAFEGKSLGMKHCVLPLETSQHRGRKCSVHQHPENHNCISYQPLPVLSLPLGSQVPLVMQREARWKNCPGVHQLKDSFTSPSDD